MNIYFQKTRKAALTVALATSILLAGCGEKAEVVSHDIFDSVTNVEVVDKKIIKGNKRTADQYIVTVVKDGEEITFKAYSDSSFKGIDVGDVLDISYTTSNHIKEFTYKRNVGDQE